jgi:hypothetical protein
VFFSEISYDADNTEYLNYFFDTFALAFKKDEKTMDSLKNSIYNNPELDLTSLHLQAQTKQKWEKDGFADSLITTLFNEFSRKIISFFHHPDSPETDFKMRDFIDNDKTIIIDLSILDDLRLKTFATFVIISKIIHLIKYKNTYHQKILFIPNLDQYFDNFYLERDVVYWKIDKFLQPLTSNGFGIVATANQIRNLHSNVFNYFQNFIAMKTIDKRDIAVLQNLMNLKDAYGHGYYSSKRKYTYHEDYLRNMKNDEIIMKRSDIYHPFPGKIDLEEIARTEPLSYDQIIEYMNTLGIDLKTSEKKLLSKIRKTLFEINLEEYTYFLEEVIKFLESIKKVDKIALYKAKVKEALLKFI